MDVITFLQIAFFLWSLIRGVGLFRIPWALFSMLFGKRKTEYTIYLDHEGESNVLLEEYISLMDYTLETVGNDFYKICVFKKEPVICHSSQLKKFLVVLTAINLGSNVVGESFVIIPNLMVQRMISAHDLLSMYEVKELKIRKDPSLIQIIENWPLKDNIPLRFSSVIPLIFNLMGLSNLSIYSLIVTIILDLFEHLISKALNQVNKRLRVLFQKFVSFMPGSIRLVVFLLARMIDKDLACCNFISNKRFPIITDRLLLTEESYLQNVDIEYLGIPDYEPDLGVKSFITDGFTLELNVIKIESQEVDFKTELYLSSPWGGRIKMTSDRHVIPLSRYKKMVSALTFCVDNGYPPVRYNCGSKKDRFHCFDFEYVVNGAISTDKSFTFFKIQKGEYEFYDSNITDFSLKEMEGGGIQYEIKTDPIFNIVVDQTKRKKQGGMIRKCLKKLMLHNLMFFNGSEHINKLMPLIVCGRAPNKSKGVKNTHWKIYVSDVNKILEAEGITRIKNSCRLADSKALITFKLGINKIKWVQEGKIKERAIPECIKNGTEIIDSIQSIPSIESEIEAFNKLIPLNDGGKEVDDVNLENDLSEEGFENLLRLDKGIDVGLSLMDEMPVKSLKLGESKLKECLAELADLEKGSSSSKELVKADLIEENRREGLRRIREMISKLKTNLCKFEETVAGDCMEELKGYCISETVSRIEKDISPSGGRKKKTKGCDTKKEIIKGSYNRSRVSALIVKSLKLDGQKESNEEAGEFKAFRPSWRRLVHKQKSFRECKRLKNEITGLNEKKEKVRELESRVEIISFNLKILEERSKKLKSSTKMSKQIGRLKAKANVIKELKERHFEKLVDLTKKEDFIGVYRSWLTAPEGMKLSKILKGNLNYLNEGLMAPKREERRKRNN